MNNSQLEALIGSRFSIITNDQTRYEGMLDSVEIETGFLILKRVRCMGTEDRIATVQVPPGDHIYPINSFSANDVIDIKMIGQEEEQTTSDKPAPSFSHIFPVKPDSTSTEKFDLFESLKKFDKINEFANMEEQGPSYKKEDFFDTLSTQSARVRGQTNQMRQQNVETFGDDTVQQYINERQEENQHSGGRGRYGRGRGYFNSNRGGRDGGGGYRDDHRDWQDRRNQGEYRDRDRQGRGYQDGRDNRDTFWNRDRDDNQGRRRFFDNSDQENERGGGGGYGYGNSGGNRRGGYQQQDRWGQSGQGRDNDDNGRWGQRRNEEYGDRRQWGRGQERDRGDGAGSRGYGKAPNSWNRRRDVDENPFSYNGHLHSFPTGSFEEQP
ncbi:MAG: hypothetical protein EZS28_007291 [Streblomastix strix]|uniref:Uncharacterized protein n=1 Tax=Streblomastix strix TaxID=222440 RepID=A0A5J4WRG0_9EUKA|nr:MAG: hypothetical protein EZS28_007291 [Streblomastix strix]